uniref:Uncharacterized protein n=1 Tax=Panagrolaimus sp. PS1159 TaxID=55785 RepID=A0AC35FAL9_9BILA
MQLKVVSFFLVLALIFTPLNAFFTYNFHQPINLHHKLKPVARSFLRSEESYAPEPVARSFLRNEESYAPEVKRLPYGYFQDTENMRKNDYFWDNAK